MIVGAARLCDEPLLSAGDFVEKLPAMERCTVTPEQGASELLPDNEYARRFIIDHQERRSDREITKVLGVSRNRLRIKGRSGGW